MRMTTNKKSDTISEQTSESESPIKGMTVIFQGEPPSQGKLINEVTTLLAGDEEENELQEYFKGNPDYDTRPKTIIRQFIITISKSKVETVEIPGIHDLQFPRIKDLGLPGMNDLESYWHESQDLNANPKPSYN